MHQPTSVWDHCPDIQPFHSSVPSMGGLCCINLPSWRFTSQLSSSTFTHFPVLLPASLDIPRYPTTYTIYCYLLMSPSSPSLSSHRFHPPLHPIAFTTIAVGCTTIGCIFSLYYLLCFVHCSLEGHVPPRFYHNCLNSRYNVLRHEGMLLIGSLARLGSSAVHIHLGRDQGNTNKSLFSIGNIHTHIYK